MNLAIGAAVMIIHPLVSAKAGTQFFFTRWIPACAGMSGRNYSPSMIRTSRTAPSPNALSAAW
jgi:hypothetical protein